MIGLFIFTFTSCEKEFEETNTSTNNIGKGFKILKFGSPTNNARGVANKILSFHSEEEFQSTLDSLENAYNKYSIEFSRSVEGLTDDEANQKIKNENIDLEKPLTDFENQYNFHSLRESINEKERVWLQNQNPDFSECPQVHSISSYPERCLWNENGEVMIAGKIYKYSEDDTKYIKINDGDLNKLTLINSGNTAVFSDPNVEIIIIEPENKSTTVTNVSSLSCATESTNAFEFIPQYNYKVVCSNRLKKKDWSFGKHSLSAGIVTYKKIGDFFSRFSTSITVTLYGERYQNCGTTPTAVTGLSKTIFNSAASVELKRNYEISTKYDSSTCSIMSYHHAGNLNSANYFPLFETHLRLKY